MNTSKKLAAALIAMALPLAACGDDAEDDLDDVDITIDDTATTIGAGTLPTVSTAPAGAATSDMGSGTDMGSTVTSAP